MYNKDDVKIWKLQDLIGLILEIREFVNYEDNISVIYAYDVNSETSYILDINTIKH